MSWENDLDLFYQQFKPKRAFREKAEVDAVFNDVVIPALERISSRLMLHAKNVKVKRYKYKATISFEDRISPRSAFGVAVDLKYGVISFPYRIGDLSCYSAGIRLNSRDDVNEDLITSHFMKYLISREEVVNEHMRRSKAVSDI